MKWMQCSLIKTMVLAIGLPLTAAKTGAIAQPAIPPSANAPGLSPSLSAAPLQLQHQLLCRRGQWERFQPGHPGETVEDDSERRQWICQCPNVR
jgi:hypothetical protein